MSKKKELSQNQLTAIALVTLCAFGGIALLALRRPEGTPPPPQFKESHDDCAILPKTTSTGSIEQQQADKLQGLVAGVDGGSLSGSAELGARTTSIFNETYAVIPDKAFACHMLMQTMNCMHRRDPAGQATLMMATNVGSICQGIGAPAMDGGIHAVPTASMTSTASAMSAPSIPHVPARPRSSSTAARDASVGAPDASLVAPVLASASATPAPACPGCTFFKDGNCVPTVCSTKCAQPTGPACTCAIPTCPACQRLDSDSCSCVRAHAVTNCDEQRSCLTHTNGSACMGMGHAAQSAGCWSGPSGC